MSGVSKILPLPDLARQLEASRRAGLRVAQCHGCFDLLHVGHVRYLQAAAAEGIWRWGDSPPDEGGRPGDG